MSCLLDTNVLCRIVRPDDPQHPEARDAVRTLLDAREQLVVNPQVIREFWSVATRPRMNNGLGMTTEETALAVEAVAVFAELRPDTQAVHEYWLDLATSYRVMGKETHDACLVASMQANAIASILTFDAGDFARYSHIVEVRTPAMVNKPAIKAE